MRSAKAEDQEAATLKSETIMLTLTIALAIALVGGLVVVPAAEQIGLLQQAHADKDGVPNSHSVGHGKGRSGGGPQDP